MIRPKAASAKGLAVKDQSKRKTILYCWAMTPEERDALKTAGWRAVHQHPLHGSVLMRFDRSSR